MNVRARFGDPAAGGERRERGGQAYQEIATAQNAANVEASVAELNALQASLRDKLTALGDAGDDRSVENERANLSEQLAELETTAGKIQADAAVYGAGIDRSFRQSAGGSSISDSPVARRWSSVCWASSLGLVGAFWRSERVRVIDSTDDAADVLDAPLLGVLPRHPSDTPAAAAPVLTAPQSAEARQHQFIASSLALVSRDSHPRALLLTSPEARQSHVRGSAQPRALGRSGRANGDPRRCGLRQGPDPTAGRRGSPGCVRPGQPERISASTASSGLPGPGRSRRWPADSSRRVSRTTAARRPSPRRWRRSSPNLQQEADLLVIDGPALLHSPGGMKLAAVVDGVVLARVTGNDLDTDA